MDFTVTGHCTRLRYYHTIFKITLSRMKFLSLSVLDMIVVALEAIEGSITVRSLMLHQVMHAIGLKHIHVL